jgi:hypothetical protein
VVRAVISILLVGCGGEVQSKAPEVKAEHASSPSPSPSPKSPKPPTAEELFAKLRPDFVACYDQGKKKVPEMNTGKVTLHASVDRDGRTSCVVPSDDTGLTQEVEECMRVRLERESYPASSTSWVITLPIAVHDNALSLASVSKAPLIETIESQGLTEEVYDVVEASLPDLRSCFKGVTSSVVYVGAKVGGDGHVTCSLASAEPPVPTETQSCTGRVFGALKFAPPKRGIGLLTVPIAVNRR